MGIPFIEFAQTVFVFIAALFPIVNPLGGATIFLTMTSNYPPEVRQALARKVAFFSLCILVGAMFLGSHVLAFFGVSLPAVQVGGGLLVSAAAWSMLNKEEDTRSRDAAKHGPRQDWEQHAFYPLTLPLTVGPGSISVALTLGANLARGGRTSGAETVPTAWAALAAMAGIIVVCTTVWIAYGSSERISRALGPTGLSIVVRLSSFILFCIGVQIFWNGASRLLLPVLRGAAH
ncbi:MAG TPA: MarC family protein [Bryobacteraceae bacterium]|nr:MarC family protein [Bryobacteraceae bacterium]HPT29130.1 MarC family protein [Bryobacteraceae bacterium]